MSVAIPTVWCPYCDSANELNSKRCWRCRQRIPLQAERTGGAELAPVSALPAPIAAPTALAHPAASYPAAVAPAAGYATPYAMATDRKQCAYCREWIDPEASVCPYCRTDQGTIAAVQRATWAFLQLFLCFAAFGVGVAVLIRLCQWGMAGTLVRGL
jgi:hypothetical protein